MSRLHVGISILLAVTASAPAHAWGRSKSLPEPRRFIQIKDDIGPARLLVARSLPRRLESPTWGLSPFTKISKNSRELSSPHLRD